MSAAVMDPQNNGSQGHPTDRPVLTTAAGIQAHFDFMMANKPVSQLERKATSPTGGDEGDGNDSNEGGDSKLSKSKRAEQNRKAQRAFRERRDAHLKDLEEKVKILDAALERERIALDRLDDITRDVIALKDENASLKLALAMKDRKITELEGGKSSLTQQQLNQQHHKPQQSQQTSYQAADSNERSVIDPTMRVS